jgi:hypothetical protein
MHVELLLSSSSADNKETKEPYNRTAISDKIRAAQGVDSLKQQHRYLNGSQRVAPRLEPQFNI